MEFTFSKEEVYGKNLPDFFAHIEKKIYGCHGNVPLLHTRILEAKIEMLEENYARLADRNIYLTEREQALAVKVREFLEEKRSSLQEHLQWIEKSN